MWGLHVSNRLAAYAEGELPPPARDRISAHLARCPRCREELEGARAGARALAELQFEAAPASLWAAVEAGLDERPAGLARPLAPAWAAGALVVAAAVALLLVGAPRPPAWTVVRTDTTSPARLSDGDVLVTGPSAAATLRVPDIGEVDVQPNSRLQLLRSRPAEQRFSLLRGGIRARIWAPPRLFFVETPGALAVDLGCAYNLDVDDHGDGVLRVTLGWVMLEDRGRESMVPAGAYCRMRKGAGPGTPCFEDAAPAFRHALADFDSGRGGVDVLLRDARARDTLTLFHLLPRVPPAERGRIFDRLASLAPVPAGITRAGALALDPAALRHWLEELAWNW